MSTETYIPRIRARTAQIDEPAEYHGQWAFEISLWTFEGTHQIGEPLGPFGPYQTEIDAKRASMKVVRVLAEDYEKHVSGGGPVSGKYLDLNNGGVLRSWDEN